MNDRQHFDGPTNSSSAAHTHDQSPLDSQFGSPHEVQLDARLDAFRTQLNRAVPSHAMPPTLSTSRAFSFHGPFYALLAALTAAAGIVGGRQFVSASKSQRVEQTSRATALASQPKPATVQTKPIHWHAAFGVYVCGKYLPNRDGSAEPDPDGVHLHDDGLIHIHPFAGSTKPTVDTFLQWAQIKLIDAQTLSMPAYKTAVGVNQPAKIYRVADNCKGSTDATRKGRAAVYQFDKDGKATLLEGSAFLRDGMVIAVAVHGENDPLLPPPPSIAGLSNPSDIPPVGASGMFSQEGHWGTETGAPTTLKPSPKAQLNNQCPTRSTSVAVFGDRKTGPFIYSIWATPDIATPPSLQYDITLPGYSNTFPVREHKAGWLRVAVPIREGEKFGGGEGWIRLKEVQMFENPFALTISWNRKQLITCRNGKVIRTDDVLRRTGARSSFAKKTFVSSMTRTGNTKAPARIDLSVQADEGFYKQLHILGNSDTEGLGVTISDEALNNASRTLPLGTPVFFEPKSKP
jgi:hypothetical protein